MGGTIPRLVGLGYIRKLKEKSADLEQLQGFGEEQHKISLEWGNLINILGGLGAGTGGIRLEKIEGKNTGRDDSSWRVFWGKVET